MQQQQQHAKLGKKRKRTSLELLMEDPLLNQETQLKLNKLLSSFKQKENFASHYRDYHSKCKHSESKASLSNNAWTNRLLDCSFNSLLIRSSFSSSVNKSNQSSIEEKTILNKLFNSNNLFNNNQYVLSVSEIKSTFIVSHFQNMQHRDEVWNFNHLTVENISEISLSQLHNFDGLMGISENEQSASEKNKKPIFHIQKIHDKSQYALYENSLKLKTNKPNWRYQIDIEKIRDKVYRKFYQMVNSTLNKSNHGHEYYSYLNDTLSSIHVVKKALEGLKKGIFKPVPTISKKYRNRRSHYYVFSSEAKAFCIDLLQKENLTIDIVSKLCDVPSKSLKRWLAVGCKRKKGCGRKIRDPVMEQKLIQWYQLCVKENQLPSPKKIRLKALELTENKDFLASKGWLEKFKKKLRESQVN